MFCLFKLSPTFSNFVTLLTLYFWRFSKRFLLIGVAYKMRNRVQNSQGINYEEKTNLKSQHNTTRG